MPSFAELEPEKWQWITSFERDYWPDNVEVALKKHKPTIDKFRQLTTKVASSAELLELIHKETGPAKVQLLRVFHRCVSPVTSVEMLKRKKDLREIVRSFGPLFRPIGDVRTNLRSAKLDQVLSSLLYEYDERGKSGYDLTEQFFQWLDLKFPAPAYKAIGPRRAGQDVYLDETIPRYPERIPADIVLIRGSDPILIGFARYDTDRGGAQEDDRTGGN